MICPAVGCVAKREKEPFPAMACHLPQDMPSDCLSGRGVAQVVGVEKLGDGGRGVRVNTSISVHIETSPRFCASSAYIRL